jgi:uncharacterized protein (TIGR03086 family)
VLDLRPATDVLTRLVEGVRDDQLDVATPCGDRRLPDLLDHIDGLSLAFALAARKTEPEGGSRAPSADGSRLGPEWRSRIGERLAGMAEAWSSPEAWTGMTRVGGLDLPGNVAGVVGLDEVIVHGWDVAVASGQRADWDDDLVAAATGYVQDIAAQNPQGIPGLFGPAVPVPASASASPLDRLLGLTGRDPGWRPPGV